MSVRETNLSKENAYGLIMANFVNRGIHIKSSDEPNHIVAGIGDWKRWLLSSQPWVDITVDISQRDDKSSIKFSLDFRNMYISYVAMSLLVALMVLSAWVALTGGHAMESEVGTFGLLILIFLFVRVAPATRLAKEQFMTEVDRFLPSAS